MPRSNERPSAGARRLVALALAGLLVAGCGGQGRAIRELERQAAIIDGALGSMRPATRQRQEGDVPITVTGYYDARGLRCIREGATQGRHAPFESLYYFRPDGKLFAYRHEQTDAPDPTRRARGVQHIEARMLFDEDGTLLRTEMATNGRRFRPSPTAMEQQAGAIRGQADALRQALSAPPAAADSAGKR